LTADGGADVGGDAALEAADVEQGWEEVEDEEDEDEGEEDGDAAAAMGPRVGLLLSFVVGVGGVHAGRFDRSGCGFCDGLF
jgi:hypothetical protein